MTIDRPLWLLFLFLLTCGLLPRVEAGEILDAVKARGRINCGVSDAIPGFSERDPEGHWRGLDIDFCRAVAAAVLGDADKVEFTPLSATNRFPALLTRQIDLLLRNTTWTLTREAVLQVQFPGILFYDSQAFLVPAGEGGVATLEDLDGATICVETGTTNRHNLEVYFSGRGWSFKPLLLESRSAAAQALFAGRCRAFTSDSAMLAALRLGGPKGPEAFAILPERISREPISPVIWSDDRQWSTIVRWVLNVLILAEEYGVTQANLDALLAENNNPLASADADAGSLIAKSMDIAPGWGERVIRAVGNYGELYERNLGRGSPLNLERGLNRLWNQGGLHYPLPID